MPGESNDVYSDLVGFLKSDRADLRLAASEATLGVTDGEEMARLVAHGAIAPLCRLSSITHETCGTNALMTLVQLSSSGTGSAQQCVEDLLDCKGVNRMTEIALSHRTDVRAGAGEDGDTIWRKRVNYALALLANMTRTERGAIELSGFRMPMEAVPSSNNDQPSGRTAGGDGGGDGGTNEGDDAAANLLPSKPTLALLTSRFLSDVYLNKDAVTVDMTADEIASRHNDPYQNFAAVLMNATQVEQGRQFVMKLHQSSTNKNAAPTSILQTILPQLRSTNPLRRRGTAGTIKNCCFDRDSSFYLLHTLHLTPKLLYPLTGPEELDMEDKTGMDPDLWLEGPDKVRERDRVTRLLLVEALLLLCAGGRRGREELRLQKVYVVLKNMDMVEECEEVSERISECVQFLRRDEDGETEGSSDRFVDEACGGGQLGDGGKMLALPAPSVTAQIGIDDRKEEEEYDDVD